MISITWLQYVSAGSRPCAVRVFFIKTFLKTFLNIYNVELIVENCLYRTWTRADKGTHYKYESQRHEIDFVKKLTDYRK